MRSRRILGISGTICLAGVTSFGYLKWIDRNIGTHVFKAESLPSNMTRAELHMWPCGRLLHLKGVLIVAPGVNGDGREVLKDLGWFNFAKEHNLLLVGISFASPICDLQNGCGYYYPDQGSGDVLEDGLKSVGCGHLPLMLYGFSGGAHFVSRFVQWHPTNVVAWCAYSAAWWGTSMTDNISPPGIVACGSDDFRVGTSRDYFYAGRERGMPWLWVEMTSVGHVQSCALAAFFRSYVCVLLESKPPKGLWINIVSGRCETEMFAKRFPCAMGWLPDKSLYPHWLRLCRGKSNE